jgi:hypothetical protein
MSSNIFIDIVEIKKFTLASISLRIFDRISFVV